MFTVLVIYVLVNGFNVFIIYLWNGTCLNFCWQRWSSIFMIQRSNSIINGWFNLVIIIEWGFGCQRHVRGYLVCFEEPVLHYVTSLVIMVIKWWTCRHYPFGDILRNYFRLYLFIEFLLILMIDRIWLLIVYWITSFLSVKFAFSSVKMGLEV